MLTSNKHYKHYHTQVLNEIGQICSEILINLPYYRKLTLHETKGI